MLQTSQHIVNNSCEDILNNLKEFDLKFQSPNIFLNCSFVFRFIQESQSSDSKSFKLDSQLKN